MRNSPAHLAVSLAYDWRMKKTWGLALFGLALAACSNGGTTTPVGTPSTTASITGTVANFSGAANTPIALQLYLNGSGSPATIARGLVQANGSFTVDLPGENAFKDYLYPIGSVSYPGCTGSLTSSDAGAKFVDVRYLNVQPAGSAAYNVFAFTAGTGGGSLREWVYADRATTLAGTLNCTSVAGVAVNSAVNVNLALKQGWNSVVETVASGSATIAVSDSGPTAWAPVPTQ